MYRHIEQEVNTHTHKESEARKENKCDNIEKNA